MAKPCLPSKVMEGNDLRRTASAARRRRHQILDQLFIGATGLSVLLVSSLIVLMVVSLLVFAWPAIQSSGLDLLIGTNWDPSSGSFGGLPFIVGTIITAILALLISLPFSLAISIFLGEYMKTGLLATMVSSAIELLAGIPSIIYGAWGLFVPVNTNNCEPFIVELHFIHDFVKLWHPFLAIAAPCGHYDCHVNTSHGFGKLFQRSSIGMVFRIFNSEY